MDRRRERSPRPCPRSSRMTRHRLPPAPSSPCESRRSPTHPPWPAVAELRPDPSGARARLAQPSFPDRPSAPSPFRRTAQPSACSQAWCARRFPGLAPLRSAHALHPASPLPPRPAAKPHPSPAGLRSSRPPVACSAPACWPPGSASVCAAACCALRRLHSRLRLIHLRRAVPHRRARPEFVLPARCLPRAPTPAGCGPSPARKPPQSPAHERCPWSARSRAPACCWLSTTRACTVSTAPGVRQIRRHGSRPSSPRKQQANLPDKTFFIAIPPPHRESVSRSRKAVRHRPWHFRKRHASNWIGSAARHPRRAADR